MNGTIKDLIGTVDPDSCRMPDSVRTPGRTWTQIETAETEQGDGTVTVDAPDQADILSIQEAYNRFPDIVEQLLFAHTPPDSNRLAALHATHLDDATFVHIPDHATIEEPVQITGKSSRGMFPQHVVVYAAPGSTASIMETVQGDAACHTAFADVFVADGATVDYTAINDLGDALGYGERYAVVRQDATINWQTVSTGGSLLRNRTTTRLAAPHATLQHALGFIGADDQHMDHTVHVIHDADNTRCNIDARGVALDAARTVYKGVQEVNENAEGTKSFQDENTITIGDACEADTSPQLQIDNNDVEATHAATTGHVNPADLFYMKSRGLTEQEAVREIIAGMFDDLIQDEHVPAAGHVLQQKIAATLGR